jgi:arsenite methyltransferase
MLMNCAKASAWRIRPRPLIPAPTTHSPSAFARDLGYPQDVLSRIPDESVEAFAGVSAVSLQAQLGEGLTVLDLGCGAGLDSLVAAERVGLTGWVIGIDFSPSMLDRANRSARRRHRHVAFVRASAEQLPLHDSSIDVALVNGIFNLNPFRERHARTKHPAVVAAEFVADR